MNIDEKIALLEKEQRRQEREEVIKEKWGLEPKISYTVEAFQRDFKRGVTFVGYKMLLIKPRTFFDGQIKIPFIEDFFDVIEETEEVVYLLSKKHQVSLLLVKVSEKKDRVSVKEWEKEFVEELKENNLYCQMVKRETIGYLDYLCYKMPTVDGKLLGIAFRLIDNEEYYLTGTFMCKDKESESMGILLEAMLHEMNNYKNR